MMPQGVLPFKYERENQGSGMTGLGGLPAYLDLAEVIGLSRSIGKHVRVRAEGQGWTDSEVVMSLILLNLAGGEQLDQVIGFHPRGGIYLINIGSEGGLPRGEACGGDL